MQLTPHFNESEFRSPHVKPDGTVDRVHRVAVPSQYMTPLKRLAEALEVLRGELGDRPVRVISGWRTAVYNRMNKGRATRSRHLVGDAADVVFPSPLRARLVAMVPGLELDDWRTDALSVIDAFHVAHRLQREGLIPRGGLAAYHVWRRTKKVPFLHLDTRGAIARWNPEPPSGDDFARLAAAGVEGWAA